MHNNQLTGRATLAIELTGGLVAVAAAAAAAAADAATTAPRSHN